MQAPINPYGKAKKMAEDIILDFSKNSDMAVMILRLVVFFTLVAFVIKINPTDRRLWKQCTWVWSLCKYFELVAENFTKTD